MATKENNKIYYQLIFAAYFLYVISIAIKLVYSAELVEIGPYFNVPKSQLSLGLTIYYVVYAVAQIALSFLLPKFNIKKLMCVTVLLSGLSFGMIGFVSELWMIWVILGLNGIFQVAIWGGSMSIFGKYLPDYLTSQSIVVMSTGMAFGTAIAYGLSAFCTAFFTWKHTFVICAVLTVISVIYFFIVVTKVEKTVGNKNLVVPQIKQQTTDTSVQKHKVVIIILLLSIGVFLNGIIYYSLTNWFPSLLKDVHNIPSSFSLLITLIVPVSVFFGPFIGNYLCNKKQDYYISSCILLVVLLIFLVPLIFSYDFNILIAIILPLLVLFCSRGVMNNFCAYASFKHKRDLEVGKLSLITNAVACVGAAIAPLISSLIMENFGWGAFFIFLLVISLALLALSFVGYVWTKKGLKINK